MDSIVCIKQVPGTTNVMIKEDGTLAREGVDSKVNAYDLYALELAFALRRRVGGTVRVVSMGPPQAMAAVQEALMLGADDGLLVTDRAFAGADVLATSYTLAQAIKTMGHYDLILCGKQTTDGDTAQVGAALAEHLGIPNADCVTEIDELDKERIVVEQDLNELQQLVEVRFPCLITVGKGSHLPKLPSYLRKKLFADYSIPTCGLADLPDCDPSRYGADGSPTRVEQIFPPETMSERTVLEGSGDVLAQKLFDILTEKKFVSPEVNR